MKSEALSSPRGRSPCSTSPGDELSVTLQAHAACTTCAGFALSSSSALSGAGARALLAAGHRTRDPWRRAWIAATSSVVSDSDAAAGSSGRPCGVPPGTPPSPSLSVTRASRGCSSATIKLASGPDTSSESCQSGTDLFGPLLVVGSAAAAELPASSPVSARVASQVL